MNSSYRLDSKRLYIADLARRQNAMEQGRVALQPLAYRVLSRRLREALAGLPEPALADGFADLPPAVWRRVAEAAEVRHFDTHGLLHGEQADACRSIAEQLFARLMQPLADS